MFSYTPPNKVSLLCFFALGLHSCTSSAGKSTADPNPESKPDHASGSGWSGTISRHYTQTSYHSAPSSETMYHIWNHYYDQTMDATITNGAGTAKSTVSLLDTSYYREHIGPRTVEQWTIDKGNAQGSGNTDPNISIDANARTYTIEVPIPATTGTKTRTNLCKGCGQTPDPPGTSGLGEDETSILVENQKLGDNLDVLSGETTERKKIDNGEGEDVTTVRWIFKRGSSK